MSQLNATISAIQEQDSLHIVTFDLQGFTLHMMSLELGSDVRVGAKVILGVKASSVAIAKVFSGELSYSNQLDLEIKAINTGTLLCSLELSAKELKLESIITKASKERMSLKVSDKVTALIKSSDLYIVEDL